MWRPPCCMLFSPFASAIIVSFIDTVLGVLILSLVELALASQPWKTLWNADMSSDVAFFGMGFLGFGALLDLVTGFIELYYLCKYSCTTPIRSYAWRFSGMTIIMFAFALAPFIGFSDYQSKLDTLSLESCHLFVLFSILKINPISISLVLYHFLSFWTLHHYSYYRSTTVVSIPEKRAQNSDEDIELLEVKTQPTPGTVVPALLAASSYMADAETNSEEDDELPELVPRIETPLRHYYRQTQPSHKTNHQTQPLYPILDCTPEWTTRTLDHRASLISQAGSSSSMRPIQTEFQRQKAKCLAEKSLYLDLDFRPATAGFIIPQADRTMKYNKHGNQTDEAAYQDVVEWKRPYEIVKHPKFSSKVIYKVDVIQGITENGLSQAAVTNVTSNGKSFMQTVPSDNCWEYGENYAGICHFRFWTCGTWKDIIVDDRLPTKNGKLVCMKSADANEFWCSLLEKAYAKLHGGYKNLHCSLHGTAMTELTGASVEKIQLKGVNHGNLDDLYFEISCALKYGKFLACTIGQKSQNKNGMVDNAYAINAVKKIDLPRYGKISLIQIQNSVLTHAIWRFVDQEKREKLNYYLVWNPESEWAERRQIWYPLQEFVDNFAHLEICSLPKTTTNHNQEDKSTTVHDNWDDDDWE